MTPTIDADDILELTRALDPVLMAEDVGFNLDPWQEEVLRASDDRMLLLASRQSGKSTVSSLLALHTALYTAGSLILLLSPTQRQSAELFRKCLYAYRALGKPVAPVAENLLSLELVNGSRIISLPGEEGTIRGYSGVNLLIVDEAARCPDALYEAVRPMLAVSQGRLVALSTPFGKRGWFWSEYVGSARWKRVKITAYDCPRITPEFLAEERTKGERYFAQEFLVEFAECIDSVFSADEIASITSASVKPLFALGA